MYLNKNLFMSYYVEYDEVRNRKRYVNTKYVLKFYGSSLPYNIYFFFGKFTVR